MTLILINTLQVDDIISVFLSLACDNVYNYLLLQEVEVINNVQDLLKRTIKEADAQVK